MRLSLAGKGLFGKANPSADDDGMDDIEDEHELKCMLDTAGHTYDDDEIVDLLSSMGSDGSGEIKRRLCKSSDRIHRDPKSIDHNNSQSNLFELD